MPIAETIEMNDDELYGAEPGLLGDELARAGHRPAVIANGDGSDPSTPESRIPPYRRAAVAALMTSAGKVPGGQVDDRLLEQDPDAPFGLRLDRRRGRSRLHRRVEAGPVVLVEGSDLVRADLASPVRVGGAGREACALARCETTDRICRAAPRRRRRDATR